MRWRTVRSIDAVDASAWDALAPEAVFRHGWFRALERSGTPRAAPRHILVEEGDRLVAAVPCFVAESDPYYTVRERIFGRLRMGPGRRDRPVLVAYSPLAQRTAVLCAEKTALGAVVPLCLEATREICAGEGIDLECWPFVAEPDRALGEALAANGCRRAFLAPVAKLDTGRFSSFADYLGRFKLVSQKRHKQLRNEINRFARSDVEIREGPLRDLEPERLAALQQSHYGRHNRGAPSPYDRDFFAALADELGDAALLHSAWRGADLLSYSVVLCDPLRWHMFLSGEVDLERAHADRLHFALNFYFPIERAISRGVRELDYGLSTYELKLRRGCALEPVWLYARGHAAATRAWLPPWLALVDRWYRHKHAALGRSAWDPRKVVSSGAEVDPPGEIATG